MWYIWWANSIMRWMDTRKKKSLSLCFPFVVSVLWNLKACQECLASWLGKQCKEKNQSKCSAPIIAIQWKAFENANAAIRALLFGGVVQHQLHFGKWTSVWNMYFVWDLWSRPCTCNENGKKGKEEKKNWFLKNKNEGQNLRDIDYTLL